MFSCYFYSSPIGTLKIETVDSKLYSVSKVRATKPTTKVPYFLKPFLSNLDSYFSGKLVKNWGISFYPRGTEFQNKVWRCLSEIPYGTVFTYSQVAHAIGHSQAFRAVGTACGQNPWLIVVPCHRVVAQQGLGGFALGLKVKSWLLRHENTYPNFSKNISTVTQDLQ